MFRSQLKQNEIVHNLKVMMVKARKGLKDTNLGEAATFTEQLYV